jgi:hypothetical protein
MWQGRQQVFWHALLVLLNVEQLLQVVYVTCHPWVPVSVWHTTQPRVGIGCATQQPTCDCAGIVPLPHC